MAATLETPEQRSIARRRYTEEEIETGLMALALNGGRPTQASRQLAEQHNLPIPATTLCHWRDSAHVERYAKIAHEQEQRTRQVAAARFEGIVAQATEIQANLLDKTAQAIEQGDIPPRDLPSASRNIAATAGIYHDKASMARDRPTAIVERRAPEEILAALRTLGVEVIDATPEDIEDADEVREIPATSQEAEPQRT